MHFKNKIIWITGASSGIGEALAYELAQQEAILILSSRREDALQKVRATCLKSCKEVYVQALDLEQHDAIPAIVQKVLAERGHIDILINNGGISQRSLVKDTVFEVDRRLMDINYLGTVVLTKALLPSFLEQKSGHIVTVTSLTGVFGTPYRSAYAATKHALHGFFDSLRAELIDQHIDVTLVCPGFIQTEVSHNAFVGDGSSMNHYDEKQKSAMDVQVFSRKMIKAIAKKKKEVYIGKKEVIMIYIKRYCPWLYRRMIARVKVK